jgi:hypothetical protein
MVSIDRTGRAGEGVASNSTVGGPMIEQRR